MKHPHPQEWIAYLYREVDSKTRSRLKNHLAHCEPCRAQIEQWRRTQQHLDSWQFPTQRTVKPPAPRAYPTFVRWAAAAMVMLALGFALGRSSGGVSPESVAALREDLREDLRGELEELVKAQVAESTAATLTAAQDHTAAAMREFVELYQSDRSAANQAISTALSRLDTAFVSLRRDLETVALNSDVGLRQTQQQLVRLADYSQASPVTRPN